MDKETLSNYGWIVICVLVLAVMLAFATPFGTFVADAVKSTTQGLFDVNQGALDAAGIEIMQQEFEGMLNGGSGGAETPVTPIAYQIIEGAGQTVATTDASFRSNADYNKFNSVKVDNNVVDPSNYTVSEGSTIVTFNGEYLATLSSGTHTLEVVSTDGSASCEFTAETPAEEPIISAVLAENDWATIQAVIKAGKVAEAGWQVGDLTPTFTINGSTKQARIVDIDGNKVTFMLTSSIGDRRMTATSTDYPYGDNINGYTDTEMKTWLDGEVYNNLDTDLKAVISPTTITCADGYNNPNGTKSATCYLFLPSIKEVGLNDYISIGYLYMTAIEAEGETFDYFAEGGYIDDWFRLRSSYSHVKDSFFGYSYGGDSYYSATSSSPVYPAFVIE